jgi:hypothetical protein
VNRALCFIWIPFEVLTFTADVAVGLTV